jgi:hypothetical protein
MFNLDTLALKTDTVLVELRHPATDELLKTEDGKPVGVHVYGTASKPYRDAIHALQNRALKRGKKAASAEVMKEEAIELLVAISEKAENLTYKGKPLNSADAFRALYSDPQFSWLKDQVDMAVGDTAAFLAQ